MTTAGSTVRFSTPAATRSSSASSRCLRSPRRGTARASRPRPALRDLGVRVETGVFGARMAVELVNDGPVTIVLE
jgi:D-Tyr-tRNAtyr deacylase